MYVGAITPLNDALGHFPKCGYTDEAPDCPCFESGNKIHQAIIDAVASAFHKDQ